MPGASTNCSDPIPGTSGGSQPLFSPDGQWLAFEAGGKEKKVRLDGSAPVSIADGGANNGADWTTTDELVLGATGSLHGLSHVSIAGGELAQFTKPDTARGELDHLWPIACPDGRTIVFTVWSGALATAQLAMTSLGDGAITRLDIRGIRPLAVLDGAVVYVQADGAVMAVPIDAARQRMSGRPVPVLDPVPVGAANNGNSGGLRLARRRAGVGARFASPAVGMGGSRWRRAPHQPGGPGFQHPAPLARWPARSLAIVSEGSKSDVWTLDLETGILSRLTTAATVPPPSGPRTARGWCTRRRGAGRAQPSGRSPSAPRRHRNCSSKSPASRPSATCAGRAVHPAAVPHRATLDDPADRARFDTRRPAVQRFEGERLLAPLLAGRPVGRH